MQLDQFLYPSLSLSLWETNTDTVCAKCVQNSFLLQSLSSSLSKSLPLHPSVAIALGYLLLCLTTHRVLLDFIATHSKTGVQSWTFIGSHRHLAVIIEAVLTGIAKVSESETACRHRHVTLHHPLQDKLQHYKQYEHQCVIIFFKVDPSC